MMLTKMMGVFWLLGCWLLFGCSHSANNRVVVYCAHDREFAETILADFEKQSGLQVVVRYDSEANKAVGLYEELVREQKRPRCDVHWNNEILATLRLAKQGLLEPYDSMAATPFPEAFRAPDRTWTGFAARARVFLVNTQKLPNPKDWPDSLLDMTDPKWASRFALAKPFFGTTASHVACLVAALGEEEADRFFGGLKANQPTLLPGNKQVAVAVGQGQNDFCLTDTDDAMAELEAGKPVALIFPDQGGKRDPRLRPLFIPNTVAMIKGCPNPQGARKLIDYLLGEEIEKKLAESRSRQIPLNPRVQANLPRVILRPSPEEVGAIDFNKAAELWAPTQKAMVQWFAP